MTTATRAYCANLPCANHRYGVAADTLTPTVVVDTYAEARGQHREYTVALCAVCLERQTAWGPHLLSVGRGMDSVPARLADHTTLAGKVRD